MHIIWVEQWTLIMESVRKYLPLSLLLWCLGLSLWSQCLLNKEIGNQDHFYKGWFLIYLQRYEEGIKEGSSMVVKVHIRKVSQLGRQCGPSGVQALRRTHKQMVASLNQEIGHIHVDWVIKKYFEDNESQLSLF